MVGSRSQGCANSGGTYPSHLSFSGGQTLRGVKGSFTEARGGVSHMIAKMPTQSHSGLQAGPWGRVGVTPSRKHRVFVSLSTGKTSASIPSNTSTTKKHTGAPLFSANSPECPRVSGPPGCVCYVYFCIYVYVEPSPRLDKKQQGKSWHVTSRRVRPRSESWHFLERRRLNCSKNHTGAT